MPEINALSLLALFGITIVVGYVGSLIFTKTKIPDVVWLFLFGILVGPVLALVDVSLFVTITPFLAALALLIILFDAGLHMNFYESLRSFPRALVLGVLGIIIEMIAVGFVASRFFGFTLMEGLLLGAIIGGTSSPIVLALLARLVASDKAKMLLTLESVLTDALVVIIAITILNLMTAGPGFSAPQAILSAFSIGAMLGLIAGLMWLFVLDKLKGRPFDYMLTLAVLFLVYVGVESVAGSGALAALAFGIVLGNGAVFSTMLKIKRRFGVTHTMLSFQGEVSFFIRSFFFVLLGIIMVINMNYIIYGLIIAAVVIVVRLAAVGLSVAGMDFSRREKMLMWVMTPRGLAAAVLSQLPAAFGVPGADRYANIVLIVILVTVVYSAVMTRFFYGLDHGTKKGRQAKK